MNIKRRYLARTVVAGILLLAICSAGSAAQTGITIHQLLQTTTTVTGQSFELPHFRNQVTAVLAELALGGQTGTTTLFFPTVVYLMAGTLSVEIPGLAARTMSAGQALVPPLRTPFNGVNPGATPTKFLTVYFGEQGEPLAQRASGSGPRGLKTTTVLQTARTFTGEPLVFPLNANQFTVLIVDFAPGAINPRHVHPPTQFTYVLDGAINIQPSDRGLRIFRPGEAFLETTIPHGSPSTGALGGRIFTIFAGEAGVPLTVPVP